MAPSTRKRSTVAAAAAAASSSPFKASSSTTPSSPRSQKRKRTSATKAAATAQGTEKEEEAKIKTAFVTVGTTRFDALVRAVDDPSFEQALLSRGFGKLVVQAGAGGHAPERLLGLEQGSKKKKTVSSSPRSGTTDKGLAVEFFDYSPSLRDYFASADLVVSHAGAGSIFETLSIFSSPSAPPLPLVAVPNGSLMHDHQSELASELAARGLLIAATPATLARVLREADFTKLKRYEREGAQGVADAIDTLSGRKSKRGRR